MAEREVDEDLASDRVALFGLLREGFARAARAAGTVEKRYAIAGLAIRLRFAGEALVPALAPALAHLETATTASAPDLTIELYDSTSTSTRLPLLAESLVSLIRLRWWERLDARREIRGYHGGRIRAVFHLGPDILSLLDQDTDHAVYWIEDAAAVPYYEKGYPLSTILHGWLGRRGRMFVHAATLGRDDGGVLLTGKGGSGKSTTTLTCVGSNVAIVGDDYAALDAETLTAHGLYNTVKLKTRGDVDRFPRLRACVANLDRIGDAPEAEKAMIFLHEHFPDALRRSMPIRAILVPRITGRPETSFTPASAGTALRALAPSTIFQLAGNERAAFRTLADVARRLPAFEIGLGTDFAAIPAAIERFLERELAAAPRAARA